MLPKKVKYRRVHRGRRRGLSRGQTEVQFGDYGIKSLEAGWITNRQIEAARIAMTRKIKRGGKVWINVFPDKSVTAEAGRDPHGLGQGLPGALGCRRQAGPRHVRAGRRPEALAREALSLASQKLPVKTKIVKRGS
jgi:large subunit ribosomal protein L16